MFQWDFNRNLHGCSSETSPIQPPSMCVNNVWWKLCGTNYSWFQIWDHAQGIRVIRGWVLFWPALIRPEAMYGLCYSISFTDGLADSDKRLKGLTISKLQYKKSSWKSTPRNDHFACLHWKYRKTVFTVDHSFIQFCFFFVFFLREDQCL